MIVKEFNVLFQSKTHGVSAFLEALEKLGTQMKGASVADKIVGKAIALLCVYAGIQAVYAETLSLRAKQFLERHAIQFKWEKVVDEIFDASGTDACPFEKAVMEINNPAEAYGKLKALSEVLQNK